MIDFINIILAFLEGFALIISPCILPILPIILVGSLEGGKKRPLGIIFGFVLAFAVFTFFSRALVRYSGIDLSIIRNISFALLFFLGVILLSTYLSEKFARFTQRLTRIGSNSSTKNGFFSGIVLGALIGLVWTPCAGPILAAVIVQTVLQQTNFGSFLVVLAFGVGAALPMIIIALFGRAIMNRFNFFRNHAELLRKILGVIIIASVVYMILGERFAFSFEKNSSAPATEKLLNGLSSPYPAPSIEGGTAWINSPPIQLSQLRGKVVLIDFWTYSCINCIRTLPYLKDWYNKYHNQGFEIIGVHSPEFDFEKNLENVKKAVVDFHILYPVVLDNNFVIWGNYKNRYWPAHYLIDKTGKVVYQHFGEGEYDVTENNIRALLGKTEISSPNPASERFNHWQTPETYLGYERAENYAGAEKITFNKTASYHFLTHLPEDGWALQGNWIVSAKKITAANAGAAIKINFNAKKVFIVMGSSTGFAIDVKLLLNGKPIFSEKGKDVIASSIHVKDHKLYEAIVLPSPANGTLQMTAVAPGLEIYTFTFGD